MSSPSKPPSSKPPSSKPPHLPPGLPPGPPPIIYVEYLVNETFTRNNDESYSSSINDGDNSTIGGEELIEELNQYLGKSVTLIEYRTSDGKSFKTFKGGKRKSRRNRKNKRTRRKSRRHRR
jgi:hypothetical protein